MRKVTKQEFINGFIHTQPDDRPVNMGQPYSHGGCGCAMIHFAQTLMPGFTPHLSATFDSVYHSVTRDVIFELDFSFSRSFDRQALYNAGCQRWVDFVGTYGELKKLIPIVQ